MESLSNSTLRVAWAIEATLVLLGHATWSHAETLRVGAGRTYAAPCAAFSAAADGDTIEIDAGTYPGDVCALTKNALTVRGVGDGRARIDANGKNALGKGIWVVQGSDTTIENIEFSGASVPDDNGAGIRQEGKNLTVRRCSFRDNQNGILAGDVAGSTITIEYSEFDHNGAGDGYSHNLYINHIAKLVFRYNYSHRAVVGHLLKSRAAENHVLYNRLSGESDGTQSYELDFPNGGKTYVIGNAIEQGAATENPSLLAYLLEGANAANPSDALFVVNNSFVNRLGRGTFVNVGAATTPAVLSNNVFFGGGTVCTQASAKTTSNYSGAASCFVDAASLDLHLLPGSPCVDAGTAAGSDGAFSLLADAEYAHPSASAARAVTGAIDIGAYELAAGSSGAGAAQGGASGSGTGGQASSSRGGATPTAGSGASAENPDSEGCGCRTASSERSDPTPAALGVISATWLFRRRRGAR